MYFVYCMIRYGQASCTIRTLPDQPRKTGGLMNVYFSKKNSTMMGSGLYVFHCDIIGIINDGSLVYSAQFRPVLVNLLINLVSRHTWYCPSLVHASITRTTWSIMIDYFNKITKKTINFANVHKPGIVCKYSWLPITRFYSIFFDVVVSNCLNTDVVSTSSE
jgi:hypothetical protein